jgi:hypothetical protein
MSTNNISVMKKCVWLKPMVNEWWERTWFSIAERCDKFTTEEVTLNYEEIQVVREVIAEFAKLRSFKEDLDEVYEEHF